MEEKLQIIERIIAMLQPTFGWISTLLIAFVVYLAFHEIHKMIDKSTPKASMPSVSI
jgi:CDP-diglyceride synthetase